MQVKRKIIQIDEELCTGCGQCVIDCAEGALQIIDGKARIMADKFCDGLGACIGGCPTGALIIIERVADDFDEAAVEAHLHGRNKEEKKPEPPMAMQTCQCPSRQVQVFAAPAAGGGSAAGSSALAQWPVQLRLVSPDAPFLQGADLLIAADCVPVAFPTFHQDLLQGRAVVMGCPKFDDRDLAVERLAGIFKTASPGKVTVAIMEVPCCSAMLGIVDEARKRAGSEVRVEAKVVGVRGKIQ